MDMEKVQEAMAACLRPHEKLLLCCAGEMAHTAAFTAAELWIDAVSWEPDLRWQNLVRLAILNRTRTAVGTGQVLLALSKLGKATSAPLPVRDVILVGPACPEWMVHSISAGLDARIWDCTLSHPSDETEDGLQGLRKELLEWSSVLDYRARRTEMGLSMELIVFPGKQLPKLPSGAKVTVRNWMPGTDIPFSLQ